MFCGKFRTLFQATSAGDSLEIMFPASKKIELFARRERAGWTCLGNEVGSKEDIRVSLSKLINRRSA